MAVIRKNNKIYEDRTIRKNGKTYSYIYEVNVNEVTGKKVFTKIKDTKQIKELESSFAYRRQRRSNKKKKLTAENKEKTLLEEFGNTISVKKAIKDLKDKFDFEELSYESLASRMIGRKSLNDEKILFEKLDKAKKLIRNLGYTEAQFEEIYGVSVQQLADGKFKDKEVIIGNKRYKIEFNYTGYEDLVYLGEVKKV